MTEHLKVTATLPRKRYVANGTQTVFTFDFVLFRPEELLVTANGTPVASGVSVAVLANGTGSATFATAPIAGTIVVVQRRMVIKRETDFQEGGDLRAKTLNDEFDFQTAALQQVEAAAARALSLPIDDADNAVSTLPIAALRANKVLAFDNAGNPVLSGQTLGAIEAGSDSAALSAAAAATSAGASASSAGAAAASQNAAATSAADAAIQATAAAASAASVALPVALASGGTGATSASAARSNLGLGTAAVLNVGTTAGNVPQLDGLGRLPAIDGSLLTNIGGSSMSIVAGETLMIHDLVYQDVFNQRGGGTDRWYKVDTDATGPVRIGPRIGIALAAIASGVSGSAQVRAGRVSGFSGLAAGQAVFASANAGAVTQTAPAIPPSGTQNATRLIGYAASTTEIDFDPEDDTVFTARNSSVAVDGTITVQHWSDTGAREREQAAYLVQAVSTAVVSGATGTNIGDLTAGGGLAAAFDGTSNKTGASTAARIGVTNGWIGKTYSPAKAAFSVAVHGSNNAGHITSADPNVTIVLRGKNGAAPSSRTDGTSLGSIAFADTANESAARTIMSSSSATWDHIFLDISHDGTAQNINFAQMIVTESLGGARDEPLTIGGSAANATATDRVTVRYDDGSGSNADTRTTFVNRTGATRDLACEVVL
jgi:hypothetical protein